jgi:predicted histone-like DNA-binding protein
MEDGRGPIMINYSISIMGTQPGTKKADITETKAYGTAQCNEILNLDAFAKHITSHGSVYHKADVAAVLTLAVSCLRELMLEGKRVKLGDLGTFHVELETEGAVTVEDFTVQNIKQVNVRWTPGKDFKNLRQEATFNRVPTREMQAQEQKVITNQETIQGME